MRRRLLVVTMTIMLAATWGSIPAAGEMPYSLEKAERGFIVPPKSEPSSSVVAADALIGRPVGLLTTLAGTGALILTLPFTAPSHSVDTAAWGLVGRPGSWTFVRPLGRSDPRFEERGLFR